MKYAPKSKGWFYLLCGAVGAWIPLAGMFLSFEASAKDGLVVHDILERFCMPIVGKTMKLEAIEDTLRGTTEHRIGVNDKANDWRSLSFEVEDWSLGIHTRFDQVTKCTATGGVNNLSGAYGALSAKLGINYPLAKKVIRGSTYWMLDPTTLMNGMVIEVTGTKAAKLGRFQMPPRISVDLQPGKVD